MRQRYDQLLLKVHDLLKNGDPPLATALLYAIRSDTHDLGTEAVQADIDAAEALYPLVNTRMLSAIQRGCVPQGYYSTLAKALDNARVYGSSIVADLGDVDNPDLMGETADLFLRHEGVEWVVCFGAHEAAFGQTCVQLALGRHGASGHACELVCVEHQEVAREIRDHDVLAELTETQEAGVGGAGGRTGG